LGYGHMFAVVSAYADHTGNSAIGRIMLLYTRNLQTNPSIIQYTSRNVILFKES